jgi:hypothetical protein
VSATILSDKILTQCRPDEIESNKQLAIRAINDHGEAGKCIILFGAGNITSDERRLGFEEGIAEFSDCEILDTKPVEFNKEKAKYFYGNTCYAISVGWTVGGGILEDGA